MRLGVGDALVQQPGVQLLIALDPQPRREEAFTHETDLVLDLTLLPARGRRAGDRLDQIVPAHLQEAAIVLPILADEDRLHRRLHVVVDAARAGALEEGEGPFVGVEHHLLRLARIGPHKHHPAVAEADVGDLHGHRHAVDQRRPRGSSRTGRPRPAQTSAARKPPPSGSRAPGSSPAHIGEPRRSRPRNPEPAAPRTPGSGSDVRAPACRRSSSASGQARPSNDPTSAAAEPLARRRTMSPLSAAPCAPCSARLQFAGDLLDRLALDQNARVGSGRSSPR